MTHVSIIDDFNQWGSFVFSEKFQVDTYFTFLKIEDSKSKIIASPIEMS